MMATSTSIPVSHALVRRPGRNLAEGVSLAIGIPDYDRALYQHQLYCDALEKCGVAVSVLPPDPLFPDGCFINDMAVVTPSLAVLSHYKPENPRQGEQRAVAEHIAGHKFMKFITAPGTLDAGDVTNIGDHYYIGLSDHTNEEGAAQLAFFLKEYGFEATILDPRAENICRLSCAVADIGGGRVLIREELARHFAFLPYEKILVPTEEKGGANIAFVNGTVIISSGYPETTARLQKASVPIIDITISEFQKMNGGINCLSIRLPRLEKDNTLQLPAKKKSAA